MIVPGNSDKMRLGGPPVTPELIQIICTPLQMDTMDFSSRLEKGGISRQSAMFDSIWTIIFPSEILQATRERVG